MIFKKQRSVKIFFLYSIGIFFLFSYIDHSKFIELNISSSCECQKFKFKIKQTDQNKFSIFFNNKSYELNEQPVLACDLSKSLKRGPNQKIVAYSLYGKNPRYYKLLQELIVKVKEFYPDHVMRVYHDDTINKSIICQIECSNSHVDFCNIHRMPLSLKDSEKVMDLKYVHAMMWRFLSIGDSFVDLLMSRDIDSQLLQRELNSVQEWLGSGNIGHIMRDNPAHGTYILGGMWSFRVEKARVLGKLIYDKMINKNISSRFNFNGKSPEGFDQIFLSKHVYKMIENNSTIHDSYLCEKYPKSKPWPTKRLGNCFVGRVGRCNETSTFKSCPEKCRPENHLDWETC